MNQRKLIEVALPLEAINLACKADKDRKTGTVRNLHKWFAPMPLPAWRALLLASVLDDPGTDEARLELLDLVEEYVASGADVPSSRVTAKARRQLASCLEGSDAPVVLDPFCGGGSTILEAQRLGLDARGSDLNPIPILISSFLTQFNRVASTHLISGTIDGSAALEDSKNYLRGVAERVRDRAMLRLVNSYPPAPNGENVIAWRWARTVPSPDPRFQGAYTPLVGDWRMSRNPGDESYVSPKIEGDRITYEIVPGLGPVPEPTKDRCLFSGAPLDFKYIRTEAKAGRLGLEMIAVVTESRRCFAPDEQQLLAAARSTPDWEPDLPLPDGGLGFRVQNYGLSSWSQMFTPRQVLALDTFATEIGHVHDELIAEGTASQLARLAAQFLALCLGKLATFNSTQCLWRLRKGPSKVEAAFGQAILPMTFDFAESNPFGGSVGDWMQCVDTALRALDSAENLSGTATVSQIDARHAFDGLPERPIMLATDPPYFGQIGYADLSDFFYIWHRRALSRIWPELYSTFLTPKSQELIADPSRHSSGEAAAEYFVDGLRDVLRRAAQTCSPDFPALIVYASRQSEGSTAGSATTSWEAMLESVVSAGWSIVGTWPVWGTGSTRRRAQDSNALATYVVLVCRRRSEHAPTETRGGFVSALKASLTESVRKLQAAAIAPVDLAQAAIGPGMAVFSGFSRVLETDGRAMNVRSALSLINDMVDEVLTGSDADFDADTRWAVTWYEQYGTDRAPFGVAEQLSKARNTSVAGLATAGIVQEGGGWVRLLAKDELAADWSPQTDGRLTTWEITHHLAKALETNGESAAADLLGQIGPGFSEAARELAYRLFQIAEKRGRTADAMSYNSIAVAWPELSRVAKSAGADQTGEQGTLL